MASPPLRGLLTSRVLRRLHVEDFLRLDTSGGIVYPFSLIPTAHQVAIRAGPDVHAMCAIDALGIAPLLGRPTAIRSLEPRFGAEISVDVQPGRGRAAARPQDTVIGVAATRCSPSAAPEAAAGRHLLRARHFFASSETARHWFSERPAVRGHVVPLDEAHAAGAIVGHILSQTADPLRRLDLALRLAAKVGDTADALIDHHVHAARSAGLSWTAIGERLRVSKQADRQRFSEKFWICGECVQMSTDVLATSRSGLRTG